MRKFMTWLFLLDFSLWFGAGVYFSAMAAEELAAKLSLDQFGRVIAVLFPPFFSLMAVTSILAWVLYFANGRMAGMNSRSYRLGHYAAWFGMLAAVVNRVVLLPRVEAIERAMGPVSTASSQQLQQFGMMHGISLLLQFLELVAAVCLSLCFALNLKLPGRDSTWR